MYLQSSLLTSFSLSAQSAGSLLALRRSAVKVEFGGLKEVLAKVRDGDLLHTVMLRREGDEIHPECTCDQFQDAPCRHLWAVIVDADRRSYLLGGFSAGRPRLKYAPSKPGADRKTVEPIAIATPRWESPALPPLISKARRNLHFPGAKVSTMPNRPQWEIDLIDLGQAVRQAVPPRRRVLSPDKQREYYFVLDLEECALRFTVTICCRERKSDATWGKLKDAQLTWDEVNSIEDPVTGPAIRMLVGVPKIYSDHDPVPREFDLDHNRGNAVLAALAQTERLVLRPKTSADLPSCTVLTWDARPAISRVKMELDGEDWVLRSHVEVPGMKPAKITLLSRVGIMVVEDRICPLDHGDGFEWIPLLQKRGEIRVPVRHEKAFAAELMRLGPARTVELPEHLRYAEEHPEATPVLRLLYDTTSEKSVARATLECRYGDMTVTAHTPMVMNDTAARKLIYRNAEREREFRDELVAEGFRAKPAHYYDVDQRESWEIKKPRLAPALSRLMTKQWRVENDGRPFLTAGAFSAKLTTGIDWFELEGEVEFAGQKVLMPELLKAVTKGDTMVALADGSIGLLPEDFLARYGALLAMATTEGGQVRFAKSQTGLLDVFLAELPEIGADERLTKLRDGIREFSGIVAEPQPAGLVGQLRGYQLEGVAWMSFLERIQLGGCLADDMGVGKTPQVLAMLEKRRALGKGASLVVVPRSLIFNWKEEAARFTPQLKVLDHSGAERDKSQALFAEHNVVLTTYGAMLRDVTLLREFRFDYAILDEAQAIKNAASESAKAARLLQAEHRLVMTGTPIENHLGELWSLFEFLNPGMLGAASLFQSTTKNARAVDEATRSVMARALRPFILRRTKGQVAKELPERIEQTIHCELEGEQKKLYTELRDFYRAKLLGKGAGKDFNKSKIQVLEALLRLRQAACHPGLIDKKRVGEPSAKLDTLLERLNEVTAEGHKALVFSQFTSLLAIVRKRLDDAGVVYEYLDGDTRDRQACVKRFQEDPKCPVFLISLKAGGTGLNLTAAEYVFLLDPWWNPAVEAQAIDRAHRIGQARTVVACRLIAQGTVEERVLELQKGKRELAEAIIGEDNRLIGNLKPEDLELLLS